MRPAASALDTSAEPGTAEAHALAVTAGAIYAPAFAWAELGTTLRKKVRSGALDRPAAAVAWQDFLELEVAFVDSEAVLQRAWELAERFALPTLYDTAFLAVAELAPGGPVPFWTADRTLMEAVAGRHPLIRLLPVT